MGKKGSQSNEPQKITTIYLFRHAEKMLPAAGQKLSNPDLTTEGKQRAEQLSDLLQKTGISKIYSSNYNRTKQTVEPLSKSLNLAVEVYNPRELETFAESLKTMEGNIAVSGHSNSTPTLVQLLGGESGMPINEKSEYSRLYVLVLNNGKVVSTVQLHYGEPYKG